MRKTLLIFFLTQAIVISVVAKKIDGLIIYPNDTIRVTFYIPTNIFGTVPYFYELQKRIIYFDSAGKKKKIKPKDALEIQFVLDNKTYRMLSRKMNFYTQNSVNSDLLDSVMFLNLEVDGYLRLFSYNNPDLTSQNRKVNYLFQKNDGELKWLSWYRPKKDMLEYMKDCDSAIEIIEQSIAFVGVNVVSLVQKYNSDCAKE